MRQPTFDLSTLPPGWLSSQLPAFVAVYDLAGRLVWTNRVGFGFSLRKILGKTIEEIAPGSDFTSWHVAWNRATIGETGAFDLTLLLKVPPGFARFRGTLGPLYRGRSRKVSWVVLVALDVSENHTAQNPLDRHLLSPDSKKVVCHLFDHEPARARELQAVLPRRSGSLVRMLLKDLIDRRVLIHGRGGYSVNPELRSDLERICKED